MDPTGTSLPNTTEIDNSMTANRDTIGIIIPAVILLLIILLSVLGNLVVILAIVKTPRLREKTSNTLLINLALTDLLNGLLVMTSSLVSIIADEWILGVVWCYAQCALNYCFIIVSMLTLALISIDGYYSVLHPLRHAAIITPRVTKLAVCYAWFQGCVFAVVPVIYRWIVYDYWEVGCAIYWDAHTQDGGLAYVVVAFVVCFLIPAVAVSFCYAKICRVVARQKPLRPAPSCGRTPGSNAKHHLKQASERQVIWCLVLVVAVFLVCMTPFCVTKLVKIFFGTDVFPPYVYLVSAWFGHLASATNPFIYAIFRRDFRRAFQTLLCYKRILRRPEPRRPLFLHESNSSLTPGAGTVMMAPTATNK